MIARHRVRRFAHRRRLKRLSPGPQFRDCKSHRRSRSEFSSTLKNARRCVFGRILYGEKQMRITLMHNPKAGHGRHDKRELMHALDKAGHKALYQSTKEDGWKKALKKETDLVLAAGGDGAVGKVAARLVDTGIPLAILPLGTANNLARTLGFF